MLVSSHDLEMEWGEVGTEFFKFVVGMDGVDGETSSGVKVEILVQVDGRFYTSATKMSVDGLKLYLVRFGEQEWNATDEEEINVKVVGAVKNIDICWQGGTCNVTDMLQAFATCFTLK